MSNFKTIHLVKNSYSEFFGIFQAFQNRFFASEFVDIALGMRVVFLLHGIAATHHSLFTFS